jgi:hypothetical protein
MLLLRNVSSYESSLPPAFIPKCQHVDVSIVAAWSFGQSVARLRPRFPPSPHLDYTRIRVTDRAPTTLNDKSHLHMSFYGKASNICRLYLVQRCGRSLWRETSDAWHFLCRPGLGCFGISACQIDD